MTKTVNVKLLLCTPEGMYMGNRGLAPLILKFAGGESSTSQADCFFPGERTPLSIEWEAGWAPEPVCAFWRREKYLTPAWCHTPGRPAQNLDTVPTNAIPFAVGNNYFVLILAHLFEKIYIYIFFHGATDPSAPRPPHCRGFTITQTYHTR
jgi:hypothetical protein